MGKRVTSSQKSNSAEQSPPKNEAIMLSVLMSKLTCSICSLHLSAFPIYISLKEDVAVCGRCELPTPTDYLRDKLYEELIKTLHFPCRNAELGCEWTLLPALMTRHERRCPYRLIKCPGRTFLNCKWGGLPTELLEHFQSLHPDAILPEGKYDLDFTNNFSVVYLMPFNTEIFVIRSQINKLNQLYECSVEHVPIQNSSLFYKYSVIIETENPDDCCLFSARHTDSELLEMKCISCAELEEDLPNANKFTASFKIYETVLERDQLDYVSEVTEEMKDLNVDWMKLEGVKCQSCYGYLVNPIQECPNHHVLCLKCGAALKCNLCQMDLQPIKNSALEGLINTLKYPCSYRNEGCMVVLQSICIRDHESRCKFADFECPLSEEKQCEVKFRLYDAHRHVKFYHSDTLLTKEDVDIDLQEPLLHGKKHFMIIHDDMVFKLIFKHEKETLMWSTLIVGSHVNAKKYNFEIEIIDKAGRGIGILSRAECTPILEKETCFSKQSRSVLFLYDLITVFTEKKKLRFKVKIKLADQYYDELF